MTKESTGFTKLGFSKSGFSCCDMWMYCDMGKGGCFYEDKDNEVKDYCSAYQRNHSTGVKEHQLNQILEETREEVKKREGHDIEQLSLF
jgi:hypothetical protein